LSNAYSSGGSPVRVVSIVVIVCQLVTVGDYACAEDLESDSAASKSQQEVTSNRQAWQEYVRDEKRRIQELAAQRRPSGFQDPVASVYGQDRWASERALNDITLERGDIVVTDRGAFVFKGRPLVERAPSDFEALGGFSLRR
jgi:hypothetical protein